MTELQIKGRPIFRGFLESEKRWAIAVAHRRCGKTVACVQKLLRAAYNTERTQGRYAYIAPLYSQAKDVAWQYLAGYGQKLGAEIFEYELRIELPNGSRVRLYGADNPDRLRGIYLDGAVLDEFADMRPSVWGEVVRPMLADRRGWCTFIGTPKGHNEFYQKWLEAQKNPEEWFSVMLRASETGLLPPDELADARKHMSEDQYAQEFECSFEAAIQGAYFARQMRMLRDTGRIRSVPIDPSRPVNTFWDVGQDTTAIWFHQSLGQMHHLVDYYENSGEGVAFYVPILKQKAEDGRFTYGTHYGPHDLDNSHWTLPGAKATVDVARGLGINFYVVPRIPNKDDAIEAGRNFLEMCWIDKERCAKGIESLDHYRKAWDADRKTWKAKPEHDWASHGADAMMTGACGFVPEYVPPPSDKYRRRRTPGSAWAA